MRPVARAVPVLRVAAAAVALLAAAAGALELVGPSSAGGAGSLTLPHPVPISAVRYGAPPLKVLLVGDSLAGSLGVGLGVLAPGFHVDLVNAGHPGCSVSMDGEIELTYFDAPPGAPCVVDRPDHLLAVWREWVAAFRPDVVVYLARSDLLNQQVHGRWTWIGRRSFNVWYAARLRQMLGIFTADGARVVLMTVPVSEEATVHARPQDNPVRVGRLGKLFQLAAAAMPGRVSIYNLAQLLTPDFRYRASVDGLPLRCADGVHLTPEAGIVVAADLFPRLWALAGSHRVAGGGRWPGGAPPSTPSWYTKLACA